MINAVTQFPFVTGSPRLDHFRRGGDSVQGRVIPGLFSRVSALDAALHDGDFRISNLMCRFEIRKHHGQHFQNSYKSIL